MQQASSSRQLEFAPQEHTDFIFVVASERFSLLAVGGVLLGTIVLVWWLRRRRRRRLA